MTGSMRRTPGLLAVGALSAFGLVLVTSTVAGAATTTAAAPATTTYQATLAPLNGVLGAGTFMLQLNGSTATVTEDVHGLAATYQGAPFPHLQRIDIGGQGKCPSMSADTNDDGVVSTTEGELVSGDIGVALSVSGDTSPAAGTDTKEAPVGAAYHYARTFTLDTATLAALQAGTAVVVVHGLDPATLGYEAQGEKSDLMPSLPLTATSPALCGPLVASQMSQMPVGWADTGGGGTSGVRDPGLFGLGAVALLAAGGLLVSRRRSARGAR